MDYLIVFALPARSSYDTRWRAALSASCENEANEKQTSAQYIRVFSGL